MHQCTIRDPAKRRSATSKVAMCLCAGITSAPVVSYSRTGPVLDSDRMEGARHGKPHPRLAGKHCGWPSARTRELAFFSGVGVFIVTADGQQPLRQLAQPSARSVRELHEVCLSIAGRNDLKWLHFSRYAT